MSDFGTAAIFFVTFLVIAYLRSGDCRNSGPHLRRRGLWRGDHRTVPQALYSAAASPRGATPGRRPPAPAISRPAPCRPPPPAVWWGWAPARAGCTSVGAGDTDLVFGMLCEEWGLVHRPAGGAVHSHSGGVRRPGLPGRAELLLRHRRLRRHLHDGVSDLPQRVRRGGHSPPHRRHLSLRVQRRHGHAIASWGLLAFLKATDTRQNASFAIRLPSRREDRRGAALAPKSTDEWEADDEED